MGLRTWTLTFLLALLPLLANGEAVMDGGNSYPGRWVPLESVATTIDVTDQVVTTIIDQTFDNRTIQTIDEATYYFPLPLDAVVVGFGIWDNDQIYYFPIEPGEQGGIGGGGLPGDIADFVGGNPFIETFENLEPGEITIRLEYTELMTYEFGIYSFAYPLQMADWIVETLDDLDLHIYGSSQRTLQNLIVPDIPGVELVEFDDDSFHIAYVADNVLPQDPFQLEIEVDQDEVGMWVMSHNRGIDGEPGHFLAVIEPGDVQGDALQKSFTFVMDKSGSMMGTPIVEAKEAAIYCISNLNEEDYLNVLAFDWDTIQWRNEPVQATNANKQSAITWVSGIAASGGTNLNDAMVTALTQNMNDAWANQILLLSDGLPTVGEVSLPNILTNISENNNVNASIFTVAAGPAADLTFLNLIGYQNAGLSIQVEDLANLAEEIEVFFLRFSSPVLTQVTLSADNNELSWDEVYPPAPYTLFAGSQTLIAGQYNIPGSTTVTMHYTVGGNQGSENYGPFEFTADDSTTFGFVPRMWAIRTIDYWLAWMAVYGEDDDIVQMIIDLSMQYGILTPYTDYNTPVESSFTLTASASWERAGVRVNWDLRPFVDGAAVDVYRRESGRDTWLKLNREPVYAGSYLDATAETGVTYSYRVQLAAGDVNARPAEVTVRGAAGSGLVLEGASPNPFNASTRVSFALAEAMTVTVTVHDILGREVEQLSRGRREAGRHEVLFSGHNLASGLYFVRVEARVPGSAEVVNRASRVMLVK